MCGFRLVGGLCDVAMSRIVVDTSLEYWVLMVVEKEEIFSSTLCSCSMWCWWRMEVRWDMQSRTPVSHSYWCFRDNSTQGCMLMVRPLGAVWFIMCF